MTAMDEQRRMLDELMGKARNEDGEKNKGRNFWDVDVDKFYLAGFSPFEEFRNTKSFTWVAEAYRVAFPRRPKLRHLEWEQWSRNEGLKAQYDALSHDERNKYGYDHDLMVFLEELVQKCEHRIRAVQEEVKEQNDKIMKTMPRTDEEAIKAVNSELEELEQKVKEGEAQAENGQNLEQLKELMQEMDQKTKDKAEILRRVEIWREESQRAVCDISGNIKLPPGARHQSIHDHEAGKQYQGWRAARQLLKEMKARNLKPGRAQRNGEDPGKAERRARSGSAARDRDRDRDRDRRDRDRDRKRERSPRERSRERSRRP